MWLEHGGEVYSLSRLLGHSTVQMTEVYLKDFQSRQARQRHNEFSPLTDLQLPRGKRQRWVPPARDASAPPASADGSQLL